MKLIPISNERDTMALTASCPSPPIASQILLPPPNVMAPRHSSDTNTPVAGNRHLPPVEQRHIEACFLGRHDVPDLAALTELAEPGCHPREKRVLGKPAR